MVIVLDVPPSHLQIQTIIIVIVLCTKSLSNLSTSPHLHGHPPGQATMLSHLNCGRRLLSTPPSPANGPFFTCGQRDPDRTQVTSCPSSTYSLPWLSAHSGKIQAPRPGTGPAQHRSYGHCSPPTPAPSDLWSQPDETILQFLNAPGSAQNHV